MQDISNHLACLTSTTPSSHKSNRQQMHRTKSQPYFITFRCMPQYRSKDLSLIYKALLFRVCFCCCYVLHLESKSTQSKFLCSELPSLLYINVESSEVLMERPKSDPSEHKLYALLQNTKKVWRNPRLWQGIKCTFFILSVPIRLPLYAHPPQPFIFISTVALAAMWLCLISRPKIAIATLLPTAK